MMEIPTAFVALCGVIWVLMLWAARDVGRLAGRKAGQQGLTEVQQEVTNLQRKCDEHIEKVAEAHNKIDALTAKRQELTKALENTLRVAKERKAEIASLKQEKERDLLAAHDAQVQRDRAQSEAVAHQLVIQSLKEERDRIKNGLCGERDRANDLWRSSEAQLQKAQLELGDTYKQRDEARAEFVKLSQEGSKESIKWQVELEKTLDERDKAEDCNQNLVRCLYDLQTQAWNDLAQAERTKDKIEDALKRWVKEDPSAVTTVSCVSVSPSDNTHFSVVSERVSIPDSSLSIAPQGVSCRVPEEAKPPEMQFSERGIPILTKTKKLDALVYCMNTEAYEDSAGHLCDLLEYCRKKISAQSGAFQGLREMIARYGAHPTEIEED